MVADPDLREQELLAALLRQRCEAADIVCFSDPLLAVKYGANNPVDALYASASIKRMSGFELARMLCGFSPGIKLHFIADTGQEKTDAMRLMAESCIMRPVTAEALRRAETEHR